MPSELKKPEPVAVVKVVMQGGNAGLSWYAASPDPTSALDILRDGTFLHTAAQLEQYAADRVREALEAVAAWKTVDGKRVQPGDKVWVAGSVGVHETTVSEPVTTYHLFGPIPVSRSYSTKKALLTALRTLKEQTK